MGDSHSDVAHALPSAQATLEEQEPDTLLIEDSTLSYGFVLLPKLVVYARNLSRDAKLLYAVLLGYAWQEQRCWPGYKRLCDDLDASENAVRKYMRELEKVHLLSQRRRGLGLSNLYTMHDPRTAKIEVQEPHKPKVQGLHKTEGLEPQKSEGYKETREKETKEEKDRSIGERPLKKSPANAENGEKALVGGEPAGAATVTPVSQQAITTGAQRTPTCDKQANDQDISPRDQALARARTVVGASIEERLRELGGANPEGGADIILDALVDVQTPVEVMGALLEIGERRLEQQQELIHIPNPTGYLISILRNLPVEAWLKGWNLTQIWAEDEEKHAQALRVAQQGEKKAMIICEDNRAPRGGTTFAAGEAMLADSLTAPAPDVLASLATEGRQQEATEAEPRTQEGQQAKEVDDHARPQEGCEEAPRCAARPVDGHARQIWQTTLERIEPKISPATFNTWFDGTRGLFLSGRLLTVEVRTTFNRSHLETRFHDLVCSILCDLVGPEAEVRFELEREQE
jgi:hypothetical protein